MLRKKTATYALLALYEIAKRSTEGKPDIGIRAIDIAEEHGLPRAYAAKILSQLAGAGILHSDRGPKGGFRLNRPPREITLFDIFDCVSAFSMMDEGGEQSTLPPTVESTLADAEREASDTLRRVFMRTTLADVVNHEPVTVGV